MFVERKYTFCEIDHNIIKTLPNMTKEINRLKVVLVEKKKTSKWLAEKLDKDPTTISKWCTNTSQPSLETLINIANALEVDVRELIVPTNYTESYIVYNSKIK